MVTFIVCWFNTVLTNVFRPKRIMTVEHAVKMFGDAYVKESLEKIYKEKFNVSNVIKEWSDWYDLNINGLLCFRSDELIGVMLYEYFKTGDDIDSHGYLIREGINIEMTLLCSTEKGTGTTLLGILDDIASESEMDIVIIAYDNTMVEYYSGHDYVDITAYGNWFECTLLKKAVNYKG